MKRFTVLLASASLGAVLAASGPAFARMGGGGGHMGGFGGGRMGGFGGGHMFAGRSMAMGGFNRGSGFNRGFNNRFARFDHFHHFHRFRNRFAVFPFFGDYGWDYGYPYADCDYLGSDYCGYGYPDYAYAYGYPSYDYSYGYPATGYSSAAPVVTGRSVAAGHIGRSLHHAPKNLRNVAHMQRR